ncbi:putative U-box domain-containing protein 42 isoform X1 [Salvia splendens]|uniref:putative U-box domain-containing protein 42 isoform X1 n=1 Tax=Salvia splendens TaxID=180675 RepID=UPI001C26BE74|nr:putative U-box domain-containing protein 42 isoform X1 [Salvia splendens]
MKGLPIFRKILNVFLVYLDFSFCVCPITLIFPFLQSREERSPLSSLAESLLGSIAEIMKSVIYIQVEKEIFTEIGCYFYRVSVIVMELHINWSTPTNTTEIIQSLCKKVELAKSFTANLGENAQIIRHAELASVVKQLEDVMRGIGENLSLIPLSTYGNHEYAEWAAKALSKEMKDVSFVVSPSHGSESKDQQLHRFPPREEMKQVETDLYSIDADASAMNLQLSDTSQSYMSANQDQERPIILDRNDPKSLSGGSSLKAFPQLAQYMEPLYDTFFCPLTKKVMEDPVTIESGVTYEREAITEWFNKFGDGAEIVCPKSGETLKSRNIKSNVAFKATIDEWKERNEAARIKVARAALSLASTENMVLEAIDDLQSICKSKPYNKVQVRSIGIIPLLTKFLEYRSRGVRNVTLELLRQLAEDDADGKDEIVKTVDISTIIKMLSSNHTPVRHASASLLLELSKSQSSCYKIGTVAGGILMLITVKYRQSSDAFASETADQILKNLEILPGNIKIMAENGYWEPLLAHLFEGSEEMKMEMASYLGEIVIGPDRMAFVAETASPALIQMVQSGNSLTRNAAFKALKQISCYHPNAGILVEAGIMQTMVDEMFTRMTHSEPMNSKSEAAIILANILESGLELENFPVSTQGHTMSSDYIVYNVIYRIKSISPDDLNINFIRILLCLIKFPKASATIVSIVKETEASYNLIELINTTNEELGVASIKLLIALSAFMGHTLSDRLCRTQGQPEKLIKNPSEISRITELHAVSANLLAKLPHQNLTLNLALVNSNTVPTVIKSLNQIQRSGTRSSRHASSYFEGLVGVLVRLTTTLYDHQILLTARTYNLVEVLTELLTRAFTDEVQKLSAIGLENLSRQSITLSRPPERKKTKILKLFIFQKCVSINLSKVKGKGEDFSLCPIHGGVCSSQETFCLLDAEAVERLLACLDHENVEVIEAALSALSSLLDDKVNVDNSISLLSEKHALSYVLNVVKEHKEESVLQKAFWVIERFLVKGGDVSVSNVSQDRLFPATLVSSLHHGDEYTRQMAEKILRHLNKMPNVSNTMSFNM